MDVLLAVIFGLAVGLIAHFALPGRDLRGVALLPALGAVAGGIVWTAMTWAGATTLDPWIWVLSIAVPAVLVIPTALLTTRIRRSRDIAERRRHGLA